MDNQVMDEYMDESWLEFIVEDELQEHLEEMFGKRDTFNFLLSLERNLGE